MTHLEIYKKKLSEMTVTELLAETILTSQRVFEREIKTRLYSRVSIWKIKAMSEELDRRGL